MLITTGFASAQDLPAHTQVSPAPSEGFDFPAQLPLFGQLAQYSNGIIANLTQANFTAASASLTQYNNTIDTLKATVDNSGQNKVIAAMIASRFSQLVWGAI